MRSDDRTRAILHGQTAPRAGHGVCILWRCPTCGTPWLQDPRLPHGCRVRLADDEAAQVAPALHARLADLPRATCRLCTYAAGGELSIDQYGDDEAGGFGVSWEGAEPSGTHLLGAVFSLTWAERQRAMPHPGIITQPRRLRAFLEWLVTLPVLPAQTEMDAQQAALIALSTPPGHGASGTEGWVWRGVFCPLPCPPLEGMAVVSLAEAMPPREPWSRELFTLQWRALARRALGYSLEQGSRSDDDTRRST